MITRVILLVSLVSLSLPAVSLCAAEVRRTVRDFGAIGDGRNDDTAAIQQAVDAGGEVRFPAGTFRLTRTVKIEMKNTGFISLVGSGATVIEMAGAGPAFHFVGTVQKSAAPADFPADFWTREGLTSVTGLAFVGKDPRAVGLQVTRTMQMTISRCHFRQLYHGIHFTERNRNVLISDCHVYDNGNIGIFIDRVDVHQFNISNCHVSYNRGGGIVGQGGAIRNLQIGTCDIEANVGPGVSPTANVFLDSTHGSIGEVEITGCTIQHYPNFPGFANIRFIGHSIPVSFTKEQRHGNLIITGNLLNDADINVHLDGARGAVISGNSIQLATTHDILIENSSEVVVANTVLDRHPRYNPERKTGIGVLQQGIVIRNSDSCTLNGLRIHGGKAPAAIDMRGGRRFTISNCSITNVERVGLRLEDVSDSIVTANFFESTALENVVLEVSGGTGNLIELNLIRGRSAIAPASVLAERK